MLRPVETLFDDLLSGLPFKPKGFNFRFHSPVANVPLEVAGQGGWIGLW